MYLDLDFTQSLLSTEGGEKVDRLAAGEEGRACGGLTGNGNEESKANRTGEENEAAKSIEKDDTENKEREKKARITNVDLRTALSSPDEFDTRYMVGFWCISGNYRDGKRFAYYWL